ncbi:ATP-binding protein [Sorangium sp. So ce1389]|uniref:ATP-binding protein n=1 Tax=Sorangium sp. So ce1389 TaxID=3133336 RepID=UPI003F603384
MACPSGEQPPRSSAEVAYLLDYLERVRRAPLSPRELMQRLRDGQPADDPTTQLVPALGLTLIELLTVALLRAVDQDPIAGRSVAWLQHPVGGSRPTVALVTQAFGPLHHEVHGTSPLAALLTGGALSSGLVELRHDELPVPERPLALPLHLFLALSGEEAPYPHGGADIAWPEAAPPLPPSVRDGAARYAAALRVEPRSLLVIRSNSPVERRAAARVVADALGLGALVLEGNTTFGLAPLLLLRRLLPVFSFDLSPGDRKPVPRICGYEGPVLLLAGPDGMIDTGGRAALRWTLPMPAVDERARLWQASLGPASAGELASELAVTHRHGAARIAELGYLARQNAVIAGRASPTRSDVIAAARSVEGAGLAGLAELLPEDISDEVLVLPPGLRQHLDALLLRCTGRERLAERLGPSARARYRYGVRALFVGPSGTGKTLAAGWLATRLGLPLYRVDLAAVTSKYIGETEKNLAQILAHAEHAEVVLLFDEADSMFGKRTDVRDANDRFANAQTNYLLQRIESYDGITLLTSNSRARFDDSFARRLDAVIEFAQPTPEERRRLWLSHLGDAHELDGRSINRLAGLLDLAGGHIRNIVLAAAVHACAEDRPITLAHVLAGVEAECRKLGQSVPPELRL